MQKLLGVFIFAAILATPAMASAASQVPAGFIALSESRMTWSEAKAYCQQQGGRLPRINNSDSWDGEGELKSIDGFGAHGASWPSDLSSGYCWTGTEISFNPGVSWFVTALGGKVTVSIDNIGASVRVVCVP